MRDRIAMYNANALKIGIFGANCSSGRSATKVPERWSASWPDCLRLARMADEAGIDFMLPIGRWKGYGGDTDFHGSTLETVTWAVGLLSATRAHDRVRHRARALVPSADRGQGVRHRRPCRRRPLRPQSRGRLERGRVRDVRRHPARARRALRLRPGMARCGQTSLVGTRRFRFRRTVPQAQGRAGLPQALWRNAADHHECRLLAKSARLLHCAIAMRSSWRPRARAPRSRATPRRSPRSSARRKTSVARSRSTPSGR